MDTLAHSIPEGLHTVVTLVIDLCGNIFGTNNANLSDNPGEEGARGKVRTWTLYVCIYSVQLPGLRLALFIYFSVDLF